MILVCKDCNTTFSTNLDMEDGTPFKDLMYQTIQTQKESDLRYIKGLQKEIKILEEKTEILKYYGETISTIN